jgi:hypothetical protein
MAPLPGVRACARAAAACRRRRRMGSGVRGRWTRFPPKKTAPERPALEGGAAKPRASPSRMVWGRSLFSSEMMGTWGDSSPCRGVDGGGFRRGGGAPQRQAGGCDQSPIGGRGAGRSSRPRCCRRPRPQRGCAPHTPRQTAPPLAPRTAAAHQAAADDGVGVCVRLGQGAVVRFEARAKVLWRSAASFKWEGGVARPRNEPQRPARAVPGLEGTREDPAEAGGCGL